jgi:hypothetical protein
VSADPFLDLVQALQERSVRFVVIGVWGANYYSPGGAASFFTRDRDLFLPADPANLLQAWRACEDLQFMLWTGDEPLDSPRDDDLARRVVEQRALVRAMGPDDLEVDLSLIMAGFEFEAAWQERRMFTADGVAVPVARLLHIVRSKEAANRDKDRLFLATHEVALRQLLERE